MTTSDLNHDRLAQIAATIKADCAQKSRIWLLADEIETMLIESVEAAPRDNVLSAAELAELRGSRDRLALVYEEAGKSNSPIGRSDSFALHRIRAALDLDPFTGSAVDPAGQKESEKERSQ